ncbi:MlaA family lipoprotein [Alteromonas lipolytica]|uniref:ABC transporter n=1 Tax=Alteromonas lipolytica TaxID=1856405 RepID=A0A1E8FHB5_9ALTE|nr:VacJ family lipoprotein [Alteromonas lipolytica]OFI34853.1 hypothetical protein BFC17_14865 [Alteromonas lipolytica]GGF54532.1 hypothetical protein GCM10011338_03410 [Alteromonas lipolytica]
MLYKGLISAVIVLLAGCSSVPPPSQTEANGATDVHEVASGELPQSRLSAGEQVTLQTSQGEQDVSPAIVSVTESQLDNSVAASQYYDPWEGFNRSMFAFNNAAYDYVLTPVSNGYKAVLPQPVRNSVGNFFSNLREPLNLLNNIFSGEVSDAGTNLGRFLINSTIGLLGLFDPASSWFDITPKERSIGDTLASYGVGAGPYLVLPLLGQSDVRGGFSVLTEGLIHPVNHIADSPQTYQLRAVDGVDEFSEQSDTYHTLYQNADDPYIYFRNQYLQGQARDSLYEQEDSD